MLELPLNFPRLAAKELVSLYVSKENSLNAKVQLRIVVDESNLSVRDFAANLNLIDRIYGRLSLNGLYSYAQSPQQHVKISKVTLGSLEVTITELVSNFSGARALIIIGLLFRYLPGIVEKTSVAYKNYEEGRLTRVQRKQIRLQIQRDEVVNRLSSERQNQLIKLLNQLYSLEERNIARAQRFDVESVQGIYIEVTDESSYTSSDEGS